MTDHAANSGLNCKTKLSAILPNYNSSVFLSRSIQSLLDQTEALDEIIIVDDGSTDNSLEIIDYFMQKHPQIRLIKHTHNQGVVPALNTGIKQASGDYVILTAADDIYASDMTRLAKKAINECPNVGLVCGDAVVHRFDLKKPFYRMLPFPSRQYVAPEHFKKITQSSYVGFNGGGGMFMRRDLILQAGLLYPETRWHADWLLYFAIAFRGGIYYINEIFLHINMRDESYSSGKRQFSIQNQVMLDTIKIIHDQYTDVWMDFKSAALVPHHALHYLILFSLNPIARRFMTKRLIWKMMINNNMTIKIGRLFPYRVILGMRKLLRA